MYVILLSTVLGWPLFLWFSLKLNWLRQKRERKQKLYKKKYYEQNSEDIKKQSLVHSEEENIDSSITDRNYMPDEPGITLDNRKGEVKELKFHSYYSDGMVLQRDTQNNIWGYSVSAKISARFSCQ